MAASDTIVPLVDLRASLAPIRRQTLEEFDGILERMDLFLGPNVKAFEQEFATYCHVEYGVALSSGTDALFAALRACGIGPGDEVIAPSLTFFATIEAIVHTGASPVLVDVDPGTLTIDVGELRSAVTTATRAVLPVHLYGNPADMDPIRQVAREHDLQILEDAAQAHGARYRGRSCGSLGDAAAFSFYFTKNLGGLGEGGFVTTRDASIANHVELLRNHGHVSKSEHAIAGYNLRMDELQAAVLRLKLRLLEKRNLRRRAIAAAYRSYFDSYPIRCLQSHADCEPVYHLFPIRVSEPDALRDWLRDHGIETGVHYRIPAHQQPALRAHPCRYGALPVTEAACRELISIPIYPELTDDQVELVATQTCRFFERRARPGSAGRSG